MNRKVTLIANPQWPTGTYFASHTGSESAPPMRSRPWVAVSVMPASPPPRGAVPVPAAHFGSEVLVAF
jgi:hypothetical protein